MVLGRSTVSLVNPAVLETGLRPRFHMEIHMNVVLVHPVHGAKVATNELEMEQDVKNGWTEYNPATPV